MNSGFGELYTDDGLDQPTSFQHATLHGTKLSLTGSASRSQDWDENAVGNFDPITGRAGGCLLANAGAESFG